MTVAVGCDVVGGVGTWVVLGATVVVGLEVVTGDPVGTVGCPVVGAVETKGDCVVGGVGDELPPAVEDNEPELSADTKLPTPPPTAAPIITSATRH